jgi:hypothetical protein
LILKSNQNQPWITKSTWETGQDWFRPKVQEFLIENSIKLKLNMLGNLGSGFATIGKPSNEWEFLLMLIS